MHQGIKGVLTIGTLYLLRAGLHIHSQPFSFEDGWQPFVCWMIVGAGLRNLFDWPLPRPKRIARPSSGLDSYTLAEAELVLERAYAKL